MSLALNIFTPTQAAILIGVAALLGAVFGSFVNCLAWRLVHGESVLAGRSHCTSCGHALGVLDLVPVVSWLALRGRCRHCGERVSPRYVMVELLMAALFAALLAVYGVGVPWLAYAALACILMGASLVDLDTYTIPNGFVIAAATVWLLMMATAFAGAVGFPLVPAGMREAAVSLAADSLLAGAAPEAAASVFGVGSLFAPLVGAGWIAGLVDGLAGGLLVGGGILLFSLVFDAVTGKTSLGGGDVKLLFVVGLFLGAALSLLNLLVACVLGLVFAAFHLRRSGVAAPKVAGKASAEALPNAPGRSTPSANSPAPSVNGPASQADTPKLPPDTPQPPVEKAVPFGPAIAAATMFTLLAGPSILTWYVGLF